MAYKGRNYEICLNSCYKNEKSGLDHGLSYILEDKKTELETIQN